MVGFDRENETEFRLDDRHFGRFPFTPNKRCDASRASGLLSLEHAREKSLDDIIIVWFLLEAGVTSGEID